jgi:hypothetical protein
VGGSCESAATARVAAVLNAGQGRGGVEQPFS